MHVYMDRLARRSRQDPALALALLEVFHLLRPPAALFGPGVLVKALDRHQPASRQRAEQRSPVAAES